uniref:MIT_C domain-containing protein n=1 Tax=Steinernema glaseri TaxID=37863 RepID=A0A1I8AC01_9BILA
MARRVGTIVDLVEVQLGGQRRFVLSLEEDTTKKYGSAEWASELEQRFKGLTDDSRRFLESIPEEPEFISSLDLCRLTIKASEKASKCDECCEKIAIRKKSIDDLENLLEKISALLLNYFHLLHVESIYHSDLEYIVQRTEQNLINHTENEVDEEEILANEDAHWSNMSIDEGEPEEDQKEEENEGQVDWRMERAVDDLLKECRFQEAAMFYRVGVVLLLKDNPSCFFEAALAAKQAEYDEVKKRLKDLTNEDRRLESKLCAKHREISDRISDLEDQGSKQSVADRFAEALFTIRPVRFFSISVVVVKPLEFRTCTGRPILFVIWRKLAAIPRKLPPHLCPVTVTVGRFFNMGKIGRWLAQKNVEVVNGPVKKPHEFVYKRLIGEWFTRKVKWIELYEPYVVGGSAAQDYVHKMNLKSLFTLVTKNTRCEKLTLITKNVVPEKLKKELEECLPCSTFCVLKDENLHDRRIILSTKVEIVSGRGIDFFQYQYYSHDIERPVIDKRTKREYYVTEKVDLKEKWRPTMKCTIDVLKKKRSDK